MERIFLWAQSLNPLILAILFLHRPKGTRKPQVPNWAANSLLIMKVYSAGTPTTKSSKVMVTGDSSS